ncbi:MAG: hypothetical protein GEU90_12340 [Gemmatimonas sp.]|nr:hypothetical protein [Gemmatimonas sp.]
MNQRSVLYAKGGVTRWVGPAVLLLLALVAAGKAEAQRTVVVHEEPRHRLVHEEGDLKLLDVQILPGDTTLDHTHVSPIMYTFISSGEGPSGGRVSANTQYVEEPFTHRVSNDGGHLFRIIALAHYGPEVANVSAGRPEGLEGEPQLENEWFRSYRLELAPGEETPMINHLNPAVIVQVSDGHTEVTKEKGFGADLTVVGDWTWRDAGSAYQIRNTGTEPLSVVVNEGRQGN